MPLAAFQVSSHHPSPQTLSFWSGEITQIVSQIQCIIIMSVLVIQMSCFSLSFHTLSRNCVSSALKLSLLGFLAAHRITAALLLLCQPPCKLSWTSTALAQHLRSYLFWVKVHGLWLIVPACQATHAKFGYSC